MLSPEIKHYYLLKILDPNLGYLACKALRQLIFKKAKKTTICQNCEGINGTVKKAAGMLKIVHEKYKNKKKQGRSMIEDKLKTDYRYAIEQNVELKSILQSTCLVYTLTPVEVRFKHHFNLRIFIFYPKLRNFSIAYCNVQYNLK